MDKKQQLLSRFSNRMKIGLSRVLNTDDDKTNIDSNLITNSAIQRPITLTLSSDNLYHNSLITVEGCPDPKQLPCILRWYNCPQNDELHEIYTSTKSLTFQPNVQDAQHKIYCQWFPTDEGDDTSSLLPSKLAEIGPLKRNPALVQDAQSILDKGKGNFDIIMPKISHEKQQLVIEGTKIHIYINTKRELKSDETDFENDEFDQTITRYLNSMNNDSMNVMDDNNVWMQTYRIKPEYKVKLSRDNLLLFVIENKGSIILKALASTTRDRDILAIVIQALADAKKKRKEKKKRSQDLIQLHIDVLDESNDYTVNRLKQAQKMQELQFKLAEIHEKMVELQKDNIFLSSEKQKYLNNLHRLREAGLLKRDEINKLSEENMKYETEISRLNEIICKLESNKQHILDGANKIEILKNEIDNLTKKLELRDSKIAENEIEILNLEDDRNQLRLTLNHLNVHVGKVQDDKSQMDQDFGSLNEEMIKYKQESRQFKSMYNEKLSSFQTLQIDYENLEKKFELQEIEYKPLKIEVFQLNEQIKQMKLLKIKLNDIQYEIGKKDENIQRLKIENEQLRNDLNSENNELTKNAHKIRILTKKLDKEKTKTAKLQSQIDEFEDRVTDSVARPLYNELQKELEDYKNKLNDMINERDDLSKQNTKLQQLNLDFKQMVNKLTNENENYKDELNELQTHNTFWKNKVKSMREEIKKLHSQPINHFSFQPIIQSPINSDNNNNNNYAKSDNDIGNSDIDIEQKEKIKNLEKSNSELKAVNKQLKKALNNELQKTKNVTQQKKILYSHTTEEVKSLLNKNHALQTLANGLSDAVADKEQNIKHLKAVMKLLGTRVTELEKTNKQYKQQINSVDHEINILENTHAIPKNNDDS